MGKVDVIMKSHVGSHIIDPIIITHQFSNQSTWLRSASQKMCQQITFRLACEHVSTHIRYCVIGLSHRRACSNTTKQSIPYPPPSGYTLPKCPLPDCPFETKNQAWDCCWCGKTWNIGGRCSCVMIGEGATYRCEHICCQSCMPSGEYFS